MTLHVMRKPSTRELVREMLTARVPGTDGRPSTEPSAPAAKVTKRGTRREPVPDSVIAALARGRETQARNRAKRKARKLAAAKRDLL